MNNNIIERRNVEYEPLIESFKNQIKGMNLEGLTGPHFPGVGECYEESKYKFAFCGMETYGWYHLTDFMNMDARGYLKMTDDSLNHFEYLGWSANWHATFWGFVIKFLAKFYNVPFKEMLNNEQDKDIRSIMKSFVWGETNSIERFFVSSESEGGNQDVWSIVKQASKSFDDLNHIINTCAPKVVFIVHSGADNDYYHNNDTISGIIGVDISQKNNVLNLRNEELKYDYYYLRNSGTHLFKLPHPTWMGLYSGIGIDKYVDSLLNDIIYNYHIWDEKPSSPKDRLLKNMPIIEKSSREQKYKIIAAIANSLVNNDIVMSGKNLQDLFNINGILTQYGTPYGNNGGRGIHKLISSAWNYYHENGDFQTAYNIARAFVNQNGEYAY